MKKGTDSHSQLGGTFMHLDDFESIMMALGENKQASLAGKIKYPPKDFPLVWFIGFDNDEKGNAAAQEMIEAAQKTEVKGEDKKMRAHSYGKNKGCYVHLYFKDKDVFDQYVEHFVKSDNPVKVVEFGGAMHSFTLDWFKEKASEIFLNAAHAAPGGNMAKQFKRH